ncbi:unnamed protein product [Brassica rapa subsp. trilocularis]
MNPSRCPRGWRKTESKNQYIYGSQINICFLCFQSIKRRKYND